MPHRYPEEVRRQVIDLQRTVGDNLRAYRKARGLSQEAFADVLIAGQLDMEPLVLLTPSSQ